MRKDILAPFAMGKVFKRVFATATEGAGSSLMSNVFSSASHSSAGWPTIEKSFDEDTMSRGFDTTPKGFKPRDGPSSRMSNRNAKAESFKSFPDLVLKFLKPLAVSSLAEKFQDSSL